MNLKADYLTAIQKDWTAQNLIGLQSILGMAYAKARDAVDVSKEPAFGTPNRAFLAGSIRWSFVDFYLRRGCEIGTLSGISASWVPLSMTGSGLVGLELRGEYTSVLAHRLQQQDDPPRESDLRFERRLYNYRNPMLMGLGGDEEAAEGLINLTLVHGDRAAEFAFLRAYDNPENVRSYVAVSGNLMVMPSLVESIEFEEVAVPAVGLKPGVAEVRRETRGRQ